MNGSSLVPVDRIDRAIILMRGQKVMLDSELAALFGVETRVLIQAVKRNSERFPEDFMFRLTMEEAELSRSRTVILNPDSAEIVEAPRVARGHNIKHLPYAFTQEGVAMLSSVLRSPRAVQVNIEIMRAFVRLRRLLQENADLGRRLDALEMKYDTQFKIVFDAIRRLMEPEAKPRRGKALHCAGR